MKFTRNSLALVKLCNEKQSNRKTFGILTNCLRKNNKITTNLGQQNTLESSSYFQTEAKHFVNNWRPSNQSYRSLDAFKQFKPDIWFLFLFFRRPSKSQQKQQRMKWYTNREGKQFQSPYIRQIGYFGVFDQMIHAASLCCDKNRRFLVPHFHCYHFRSVPILFVCGTEHNGTFKWLWKLIYSIELACLFALTTCIWWQFDNKICERKEKNTCSFFSPLFVVGASAIFATFS